MSPPPESKASAEGGGRTAPGELCKHTIPRPTFAPAGMAFGITFSLWGLVTSPVILVVGLVVMAVSLMGWIGELRHEE
jgi:hypothetical protein